jgi:nitrite reductase/ring-hydroxylating ferredoxin subunit
MAEGTRVCRADEVAPGEHRRVTVGRKALVLCRSAAGEFYAVSDNCPHQGASLCKGKLDGLMSSTGPGRYAYGREGEILRCPWHAWEFDVTTGRSVWGEDGYRLATYPVAVEDGDVIVGSRKR